MTTRAQAAIRSARQDKAYLRISHAELKCLAASKLNPIEFKVWILLAMETQFSDDYCCQISFVELARLCQRKPNSMYKIVHAIEQKGFVRLMQQEPGEPLYYYLHLPSQAVANVNAYPNRKSKHTAPVEPKSYPQQGDFFDTPPGKKSQGGYEKNQPHSLYYNNKYNNTYDEQHDDVDFIDSEHAEGLKLQSEFDSILKSQDPALPIRERIQNTSAHFTDTQLASMQRAVEASEQQERKQFCHRQSQTAPAKPTPKRTILPEVKALACELIPNIVAKGAVKGYAATKSAASLLDEVFYYIGTAGIKSGQEVNQRKQLFTAHKLMRNGDWQQPNGLARQQSIEREQNWQQQKQKEATHAIQNSFIKQLFAKPVDERHAAAY